MSQTPELKEQENIALLKKYNDIEVQVNSILKAIISGEAGLTPDEVSFAVPYINNQLKPIIEKRRQELYLKEQNFTDVVTLATAKQLFTLDDFVKDVGQSFSKLIKALKKTEKGNADEMNKILDDNLNDNVLAKLVMNIKTYKTKIVSNPLYQPTVNDAALANFYRNFEDIFNNVVIFLDNVRESLNFPVDDNPVGNFAANVENLGKLINSTEQKFSSRDLNSQSNTLEFNKIYQDIADKGSYFEEKYGADTDTNLRGPILKDYTEGGQTAKLQVYGDPRVARVFTNPSPPKNLDINIASLNKAIEYLVALGEFREGKDYNNEILVENAIEKKYDLIIELWGKIINKLLNHVEMLKLASLNVDIIIQRFLVNMKNSLGYTGWDNVVLLFMGLFYINIIDIGIAFPVIEDQDNEEFKRRTKIDGKNFMKFYNAIFHPPCKDSETCEFKTEFVRKDLNLYLMGQSSQATESSILPFFVPTFLKFIPLLLKKASKFKISIVAYIIKLIDSNILQDVVLFTKQNLIKRLDDKQDELYTILQDAILKSYSPILTYIRVRGTSSGNDTISYNRRFRINTHINKPTLLVEYNDHNFPYYDRNSPFPMLDSKLKDKIIAYNNVYNNKARSMKKIFGTPDKVNELEGQWLLDYDYKYVIGPFTRVFNSLENNLNIANKVDEIFDLLIKRKTVFVMGYGASGAGKTSALIYFNKGSKPEEIQGILSHLCNRMGEKGFKNINVTSSEFFTNSKNPTSTNPVVRRMSKDGKNFEFIKFEYKNPERGFTLKQGFEAGEGYEHVNDDLNIDRIDTCLKKDYEKNDDGKCIKTFPIGEPLGEVLVHIIDSDRYVKATTNNPNSSRSHAMICISFISETDNSDEEKPTLIIGDFAGVENAFACEDRDVLQRFVNIHEKNDALLPYFYKKYNVEAACGKDSYPCQAGGNEVKTGGVAQEIPISGCIFDDEDMYSFSESKYTRYIVDDIPLSQGPPKDDRNKFFNEFPLVYTAIERLLLNSYGINVDADIVESFKKKLIDAKNNDPTFDFTKKKTLLTGLFNDRNEEWGPKIVKNELVYNKEELEKQKMAAAKDNKPLEEINKITPFLIMGQDIAKVFQLVDTVTNMDQDSQITPKNKTVKFIMKFISDMGYGFITEWTQASYTYLQLAKLKDAIDNKTGHNSNTYKVGRDAIDHFGDVAYEMSVNYRKFITFTESTMIVPKVYNLKQGERLGKPAYYDSNNALQYEEELNKEIKVLKFSLNLMNVPKGQKNRYDWNFIPFGELARGGPEDIGVKPPTGRGYWANEWVTKYRTNLQDELIRFYDEVLDPIFGKNPVDKTTPLVPEKGLAPSPSGFTDLPLDPKFNQNKVLKEIKPFYDAFWSAMEEKPDDESTSFELIYLDPISKEYNFGTINQKFLFGIIGSILKNNALLSKIIPSISVDISTTNHVTKLLDNIKEFGLDFTKRKDKLGLKDFRPKDADQWTSIIKIVNGNLPSLLKGFMCKFPLAYDICKVRLIEGRFINDSLTKMRDFIKQLIDTKLENSLSPLPLFEDICLPNDYCDEKGNCFTGPTSKEYTDKNSPNILTRELESMVNASMALDNTDKNRAKFSLDQLNLCIFCVLNLAIDKATNNPPPIPYIDTTKIKKIALKFKDMDKSIDDAALKKMDEELFLQSEKLKFKLLEELKTPSDDMGATIVSSAAYKNAFISIQDYLSTKYKLLGYDVDGNADIENKIFIKSILKVLDTPKPNANASIDKVINNVFSLIREISKPNAASAIGTLEFLDQVSKYYLTSGMCFPDNFDQLRNEQGWYDIKDSTWIKNLPSGGESKKKRAKKIKNVIIK